MMDGLITDSASIHRYVTAGKATFTLVSPKTGRRFTYRMIKQVLSQGTVSYTINLLQGDNNDKDYHFIGRYYPCSTDVSRKPNIFFIKHGQFYDRFSDLTITNGLSYSESAIAYLLLCTQEYLQKGGEFWHSGRCGRCGRLLTDPASIKTGLGPHCRRKECETSY